RTLTRGRFSTSSPRMQSIEPFYNGRGIASEERRWRIDRASGFSKDADCIPEKRENVPGTTRTPVPGSPGSLIAADPGKTKECEEPDSNRRTPTRIGPEPIAFDLARQPSRL